MGKQNNDAENIDENHDAIREVTNGMPFSAKQSEWDKMSKISSRNLIEVAAIAKRAMKTANIAKVTACKPAKKIKFNRRGKQHVIALECANEASAHADRAEAESQLAEARHSIAEQEDNDVHLIHKRLFKKQKAAFIAAKVAAKMLVQRARCKTVLTTAASR